MHEVTQAAVQFGVTQVTETKSPVADLILHTHWAIFCLSRAIQRQGPNIREDFPLNACSFLQRLSRVRRSGAQARAVQSISDINQFRPALQLVRCPASSKKDGGGGLGGGGGGGGLTPLPSVLLCRRVCLRCGYPLRRNAQSTGRICVARLPRAVFSCRSDRARARAAGFSTTIFLGQLPGPGASPFNASQLLCARRERAKKPMMRFFFCDQIIDTDTRLHLSLSLFDLGLVYFAPVIPINSIQCRFSVPIKNYLRYIIKPHSLRCKGILRALLE